MKKQINSPFAKAKAKLKERKFRLWYDGGWVDGEYLVYQCELTGQEYRTEELIEENQKRAEEYLAKRKTPRRYD